MDYGRASGPLGNHTLGRHEAELCGGQISPSPPAEGRPLLRQTLPIPRDPMPGATAQVSPKLEKSGWKWEMSKRQVSQG
jgi:hypothetical protein